MVFGLLCELSGKMVKLRQILALVEYMLLNKKNENQTVLVPAAWFIIEHASILPQEENFVCFSHCSP
jgi:hypothetical protein